MLNFRTQAQKLEEAKEAFFYWMEEWETRRPSGFGDEAMWDQIQDNIARLAAMNGVKHKKLIRAIGRDFFTTAPDGQEPNELDLASAAALLKNRLDERMDRLHQDPLPELQRKHEEGKILRSTLKEVAAETKLWPGDIRERYEQERDGSPKVKGERSFFDNNASWNR